MLQRHPSLVQGAIIPLRVPKDLHGASGPFGGRGRYRERILAAIKEDPGLHYHELLRRVGSANGTLRYHLHLFERTGMIHSLKVDGRRLFFPGDFESDRPIARRSDTGRRILEHVERNPGFSNQALAITLEILPSDVSYHLRKFRIEGQIREERNGRFVRIYIAAAADVSSAVPQSV